MSVLSAINAIQLLRGLLNVIVHRWNVRSDLSVHQTLRLVEQYQSLDFPRICIVRQFGYNGEVLALRKQVWQSAYASDGS